MNSYYPYPVYALPYGQPAGYPPVWPAADMTAAPAMPSAYPMYPYYPQPGMAPVQAAAATGMLNTVTGSRFVRGLLIGAVAAYVLTNESVQQNAIKAAVKAWATVQGGVEEMKERFRDAEAELHAANMKE